MEFFLTNLGFIGSIIFNAAYIPQVIHLVNTKDSTGISITSWVVWLIGASFLLTYAIYLKDPVFILLTSLETLANIIVIYLALKYKK